MTIFYSDHYPIPLPEGHRFPGMKYRLLRDYLVSQNIVTVDEFSESPMVTPEILQLAHTAHYVEGMRTGSVETQIIKRIGLPWSYELYVRSCVTVGGAIEAAKSALANGISGNLAGGAHHAHADRGEGYCVFNDIAVATRYLKTHHLAKRIAIIDLDVHQGNGNSSILAQDEGVFIFSMHGEKNYPSLKVPSHLDMALPDGAGDELFLEKLTEGLAEVARFAPDFIFYQMGVDPLKEDTLGRMNLTFEGLMKRDEIVLNFALHAGTPISLALGGGYARPIELSVQAYANTYRVAKRIFQGVTA